MFCSLLPPQTVIEEGKEEWGCWCWYLLLLLLKHSLRWCTARPVKGGCLTKVLQGELGALWVAWSLSWVKLASASKICASRTKEDVKPKVWREAGGCDTKPEGVTQSRRCDTGWESESWDAKTKITISWRENVRERERERECVCVCVCIKWQKQREPRCEARLVTKCDVTRSVTWDLWQKAKCGGKSRAK